MVNSAAIDASIQLLTFIVQQMCNESSDISFKIALFLASRTIFNPYSSLPTIFYF